MKTFPEPQVTISKEEYDQLVECRDVLSRMYYDNCLAGNNITKWTITKKQLERIEVLEDIKGY